MPNKIIPQEHRDFMVASYLAGATAKEAANQFGYSYMACIFALKQKGIEPRTNGKHIENMRLRSHSLMWLTPRQKRTGLVWGERKSFTVYPCEDIPRDLLSHYWREVFDGDGFIAEPKRRVERAIERMMRIRGA